MGLVEKVQEILGNMNMENRYTVLKNGIAAFDYGDDGAFYIHDADNDHSIHFVRLLGKYEGEPDVEILLSMNKFNSSSLTSRVMAHSGNIMIDSYNTGASPDTSEEIISGILCDLYADEQQKLITAISDCI